MRNILLSVDRPGDLYGYYQIGNFKTYSKYELIDTHYRLPQQWKWNYNDDFFKQYDWSVEPHETIDELYKKRAEQLRRDYDYLILYYSGGHDSTNMLYAFLENNIPIDEICIFYTDNKTDGQHEELHNFTYKKLQFLKIKYPKLVIRRFNYAEYMLKWNMLVKETGYGGDIRHMFGHVLTVNRLIISLLHKFVPDWEKLLEKGKKIAWVWGVDKPRLRYNAGKWIFNFHDIIQWIIPPLRQVIDDGTIGTYEFFYWSPSEESVKILIKQCHMLKEKYKEQAQEDFPTIPNAMTYKAGYGHQIDVSIDYFKKIIYPRNFKFGENFYNIKPKDLLLGSRDHWLLNTVHEASKSHKDIFLFLKNKLYNHYLQWYNDGKNLESGFLGAISQDYII